MVIMNDWSGKKTKLSLIKNCLTSTDLTPSYVMRQRPETVWPTKCGPHQTSNQLEIEILICSFYFTFRNILTYIQQRIFLLF